jgi:PAS domain S-box-containing protein
MATLDMPPLVRVLVSEPIRHAVEQHPEPHFVVRPGGDVVLVNRALVQLLGDAARELPGRCWSQLLRGADRAAAAGSWPTPGRHVLHDEAGASVPCDLVVLPWEWCGESAALVLVRDARADADVRVALRQSEASFRQMAENVPGALFRYELRPDGTDTVRYMSPRCFDLWELEADEVEADASRLWAMIVDEDRAAMFASVQRSAATLTPWFWEWRIVTPSGKTKWLQGSGRPERLDDGTVLWNSFIIDVSERHRHEESERRLRAELRQAQQLEALGRLAGGIAHDFNNMLTVILGYGESARAQAVPGSDLAADLDELLDGARRSADLTRQLLSFARRQPSRPVRVHVPDRLRALEKLLRRLAGAPVHVRFELADPCPAIRIDPVQLDQIVTNLVLNARDAMPSGGTVRIVAGKDAASAGLTLTVADDGIGMDDATRERIFEPFFSTKTDGRGTGLGMATVFGIVQEAQGRITVESAPGRGTAVTIVLPAAGEAPDPAPDVRPAAANRPMPRGLTVLLVEDDPQVRRFAAGVLRDAGCTVLEAADGLAALDRASRPDAADLRLLVSDVVLPGCSGPELARRLGAERPSLLVLFMTGYVADDGVRRAVEGMGVPVLAKPFTAETLRGAVADLLVGAGRA